MGAVRADHLDDRADVADLAVVAVVVFERLHLPRPPAHLALVTHLAPSRVIGLALQTICDRITLGDISERYIIGDGG